MDVKTYLETRIADLETTFNRLSALVRNENSVFYQDQCLQQQITNLLQQRLTLVNELKGLRSEQSTKV